MSVIVEPGVWSPEIFLLSATDLADPLRYKNSAAAMFSMESLRELAFNIHKDTNQSWMYFERVN